MFVALVNWDKCTGCGDCIKVCPAGCFKMSGEKSEPYRSAYCINCGACLEVCKADAIIISIGWGG
ncbi:MAG: 4Fe-4S binding protein [Nitrospiraceae bacterium]|nr:4Fe-4S binding protein [Nitrospiraceae bacterium]MDA8089693.1 4Fe-4S binding protein [Nitrospiraceae bacterium]